MKWTTFSLIAALAMLSNACERHAAVELEGAHGSPHAHGAHPAQPPVSTPLAPASIGTNPAGSAPVKAADTRAGAAQIHPDTAPHAKPALAH